MQETAYLLQPRDYLVRGLLSLPLRHLWQGPAPERELQWQKNIYIYMHFNGAHILV
jgi:hypothetical protein